MLIKNILAGTVKLGGNYPTADEGNYAMYTVALVERDLRVSDLTTLGKAQTQYQYVPAGLKPGARVYSDSSDHYTRIPELVEDAGYIMTASADKSSPYSRDLIQFRVNQPVTVYIAYDDRYKSKPNWLEDFWDTGLNLDVGRDSRLKRFNVPVTSRLSLYKRNYDAGYIKLKGNARTDERHTMYTVLITSQRTDEVQCVPGPDQQYPGKYVTDKTIDTDGDGLDDGWEQALAEMYSPLLIFDRDEGRWPTSARWFVQHSDLITLLETRTGAQCGGGITLSNTRKRYVIFDKKQLEKDPKRVLRAGSRGRTYESTDFQVLASDLRSVPEPVTGYKDVGTFRTSPYTCTTMKASAYYIDLNNEDPEARRGEGAIPGSGGKPDKERLPYIPIYVQVHRLLNDVDPNPTLDTTGMYRLLYFYGFSFNAISGGTHEGDWERLEVYVDPDVQVCSQDPARRHVWLRGIRYYAHCESKLSLPKDFKNKSGIPQVFVETGQHGFFSGTNPGRTCRNPYKRDVDGNGLKYRVENVVNLGEPRSAITRSSDTREEVEDREIAAYFNGYFGSDHSGVAAGRGVPGPGMRMHELPSAQ